MRRRGAYEAIAVFAIAAVAAVVMTYPLAFRLGRVGRLETGDGQFSIWNVAWIAHALTTRSVRLFDANIFYPHTGTLLYSESNIAAGVLATPAWTLTHNPYLAHNVVLLLTFILSAVGMYYLARLLTGSRAAAAVAAVLFAYCPFVYARTAHMQLLMTATLPFSMLAFHRIVERPTLWRGVVLGLALAATVLACGYYSVFVATLIASASVYYLVARRYWRRPAYYLALVSAALLAVALVWPVITPYLGLTSSARPFRSLADNRMYSANLQAYLAAAGWGNGWMLRFAGSFNEVLFPGFVTLVLAAVGLWVGLRAWFAAPAGPASGVQRSADRDTTGFYAVVAALAFWLSFGPDAGLYRLLYEWVPLFTLMRAPARFGLIVTFALVIFASVGLAALLRHRRRAPYLAVLLSVMALAELSPVPLDFREAVPPAKAYRILATLPPGAVAEFPFFWRPIDFHRHTYYMRYSTFHWMPLVNGYSDYIPTDFQEIAVPVSYFPTLESFTILQRYHTRYAVFHSSFYHHRSLEQLKQRIEQYREYLRPVWTEGDVWLYEIVGWPTREPN